MTCPVVTDTHLLPQRLVGTHSWVSLRGCQGGSQCHHPPAGAPRALGLWLESGTAQPEAFGCSSIHADSHHILLTVLCLLCVLGSPRAPWKSWLTWPPRTESKYELLQGAFTFPSHGTSWGMDSFLFSCSGQKDSSWSHSSLPPALPGDLQQHSWAFSCAQRDPALCLHPWFSWISKTAKLGPCLSYACARAQSAVSDTGSGILAPELQQLWIPLLSHFSPLDFVACSSESGQWQKSLAAPSIFLCFPAPESPPPVFPEFLGTLNSTSPPKLISWLPLRCSHLSHEGSQTSCSARGPVLCPFLLHTHSLRWESPPAAGPSPFAWDWAQMWLWRGPNPACSKTLPKGVLNPSSFCVQGFVLPKDWSSWKTGLDCFGMIVYKGISLYFITSVLDWRTMELGEAILNRNFQYQGAVGRLSQTEKGASNSSVFSWSHQ